MRCDARPLGPSQHRLFREALNAVPPFKFASLEARCDADAEAEVRVVVRQLVGAPLEVRLPAASTVDDLKAAIQGARGTPAPRQVLSHDGTLLRDGGAFLPSVGPGVKLQVVLLEVALHKLVVQAWGGRKCHDVQSYVPDGAHLQTQLELQVPTTTNIGRVKELIHDAWPHYKVEEMSLHMNQGGLGDASWREPAERTSLEDHHALSQLAVVREGFLLVSTRWPRRLRLEFSDGACLDLELEADLSMFDLRRRIAETPLVPSYARTEKQLRLVLKPGTPMVCNSITTVADYNIQDGATIYCLPMTGACLGRPAPFCTAHCGPHRCKCRWRDTNRPNPSLDAFIEERGIQPPLSDLPAPIPAWRRPPPRQLGPIGRRLHGA